MTADELVDLDALRSIPARWTGKRIDGRAVRVIVIHDMEAPESTHCAEDVAHYFAAGKEAQSSAHLCVDNDSVVRCVDDDVVAYAAPGCNADGIQIELAGYGTQNVDGWLDPFGVAMLNLAAGAVALYAIKYDIPIVHLTDDELRDGRKGIVGHYQVSRVYKKSDHMDPGSGFPWDYFIDNANERFAALRPE
jgi:N-acetyl-anhydromuramyl-L-alanine amidase AmpD